MFEISESQRYPILTDTTSMLGELHWCLLKSSAVMSSARVRVWEKFSDDRVRKVT
jgi:hypothetical protein